VLLQEKQILVVLQIPLVLVKELLVLEHQWEGRKQPQHQLRIHLSDYPFQELIFAVELASQGKIVPQLLVGVSNAAFSELVESSELLEAPSKDILEYVECFVVLSAGGKALEAVHNLRKLSIKEIHVVLELAASGGGDVAYLVIDLEYELNRLHK